MKNKDFAELARRLLPDLQGFAIKTPLMFITPVQHTLRGLCFESHSYEPMQFYIWVFFLPLFIPTKHVSFNLGKRIEGPRGKPWNAEGPNLIAELSAALKREALPFLSRMESPHDLAKAATSLRQAQDPYVQQAIAYALARTGEVNKAVAALEELAHLLDVKVPWQREMTERAYALKSQLLGDASGAQRRLEAWEAESVCNLGLEKFR
ncbi:MAG: hypothetical protein HY721_20135 [Planctomycetes bacterium]|nr:hypothetical protein [Planctomycetota bacterium]